jgi:hypothetical protein
LESVATRPRQARYQAALRPDVNMDFDYKLSLRRRVVTLLY